MDYLSLLAEDKEDLSKLDYNSQYHTWKAGTLDVIL